MPTSADLTLHVDPVDVHAKDISTASYPDLVTLELAGDRREASCLSIGLLGSLEALEHLHAVIGAKLELVRFRRQLDALDQAQHVAKAAS